MRSSLRIHTFNADLNTISNKDLEKLWFLYKTEAQSKGMSTNEFCQVKGIPYHEFEKWYKKTHRTVAPVEIVGKPAGHEETADEVTTEKGSKNTKVSQIFSNFVPNCTLMSNTIM